MSMNWGGGKRIVWYDYLAEYHFLYNTHFASGIWQENWEGNNAKGAEISAEFIDKYSRGDSRIQECSFLSERYLASNTCPIELCPPVTLQWQVLKTPFNFYWDLLNETIWWVTWEELDKKKACLVCKSIYRYSKTIFFETIESISKIWY